MRVIRCPICDEPQPGFANFCAACGKTLIPSPTSTTARISRPRSFKVPRFYALGNNDEAVFGELLPTETVKIGQRAPRAAIPETPSPLDLFDVEGENGMHHANWQKILDERPPRALSLPRIPVVPPYTPLPPVEYSPSPYPRRRRQNSMFFLISTLLVVGVLIGGLIGVIVTLGRGVLAQKPLHSTELSLQVTPSTVALGALITLRGTNFSPHVRVGLTRDATIPIVDTANNTIIQANSLGTFTDAVVVAPDWLAGSHVIRAEDALLHKSAAFTIFVTGHSPSLLPAHLLLSTNTLDLGSGDQATNSVKNIILTDAGGGQISWQSTTTQPWLLLSPKSGTFAGGQSISVTIAADRSNLNPGSYSAQIIFTSNAGQRMLPVKMKTTLLEPGHEPILSLTPAVLSFSATDGGQSPPAQVVTVSNPGVLPLHWGASISGGNDWLSISPSSGAVSEGESQAVVIGVNSSTQLPGTYHAVITFAGQGSVPTRDSPQSIYISLTIAPQCALQVSPDNLAFTSVYLHHGPAAEIISLTSSSNCTQPLKWSATVSTNNGGDWLNIRSTHGTTPAYPVIRANAADLAPGVYTGSILFSSAPGTQTLPVTLTIEQAEAPLLATTPATMAFSGVLGQPSPAAQTITIMNTAGGTLNWHATASTDFGGAWLSISPTDGALGPNESTTGSVTVTLLNGLTPNTYTGTITITGTDNAGHVVIGSPQVIPVSFTVLPPCTLGLTPTAMNFVGVAGQPNPARQSAVITANGACSRMLHWTAFTSSPWLTISPASGDVSLSSPTKIKIGVALAGLTANTYTGLVSVAAVGSIDHLSVGLPQTITITLTVQPPCTLLPASSQSETFSSEAGGNPNPAGQSFSVGIIGACSSKITITPTATQGWLSISPSSATITRGSATFTVTVASASLSAGKYSDTISLAAVNGYGITIIGSPQTLGVNLMVNAPPLLAVGPSSLSISVATGTSSQPINISNTGAEPLNWTAALAAGAPAFVSLSAGAGSNLAGGTSTSVSVIVAATGVPGGSTFTTSVTVSAIDPLTGNVVSGSPATVSVTITVASPNMLLDTNVLASTTTVGVNPGAQTITLTNSGGDGLSWSASAPSQSWLTLGLSSGSNNSGASSTILFTVNVSGLSSGTYTATVVFTPSVGPAQTVTFTLTIN